MSDSADRMKILKDGTLCVTVDDFQKVKRVLVQDNYNFGGLYYPDNVPSADRPQEWIPCSERLPNKYEQVLCCNKDGRVFSSALTYVHPEYKYWYFGKHRSVIAWMPLPKPWKGVASDYQQK